MGGASAWLGLLAESAWNVPYPGAETVRLIVVQSKSKRLTHEARKGNDQQLRDDFGVGHPGRLRPGAALRRVDPAGRVLKSLRYMSSQHSAMLDGVS